MTAILTQLSTLLKNLTQRSNIKIIAVELWLTAPGMMLMFELFLIGLGGAERDRTADLLRARQALSQLSYSPLKLKAHSRGRAFYNIYF